MDHEGSARNLTHKMHRSMTMFYKKYLKTEEKNIHNFPIVLPILLCQSDNYFFYVNITKEGGRWQAVLVYRLYNTSQLYYTLPSFTIALYCTLLQNCTTL